jgi:transposase-like protein
MRNKHSAYFRSEVALAAIRREKTISQLAMQYKVSPTTIGKWKRKLLEHCNEIFHDGRKKRYPNIEDLYRKIGRLEVENEFLKKNLRNFRNSETVTVPAR